MASTSIAATIVDVESFLIDAQAGTAETGPVKATLLVRVTTAEGAFGWGECHTLEHREHAAVAMVNAFGRLLHELAPDRAAAVIADEIDAVNGSAPGIDASCALSGLEIALWDLRGKLSGRPVWHMLSGTPGRVPVYETCWRSDQPAWSTVAELAKRSIAAGFTSVKVYPFQQTSDIAAAVELVAELRAEVGPGVRLLVDCARSLTRESAVAFAELVEPYRIGWIEEPVRPRDLPALSAIQRAISQPVVTGETACGRGEFTSLLDFGCAEIINPDVTACGGISELVAIASVAQRRGVGVAPHNYNTMLVGLAASIHAAAAMHEVDSVEHFHDIAVALAELGASSMTINAGTVSLTNAPGLGVEIDETWLRAHSTSFPARQRRSARDLDLARPPHHAEDNNEFPTQWSN